MIDVYPIALFGEAEKGDFNTIYLCRDLHQLLQHFGNPPPDSKGLYFAVQALMHNYDLLFFRVQEEGYSYSDYLYGLKLLREQEVISKMAAIFLPGVGDRELIHYVTDLCDQYHSVMITSEPDLYDYLTAFDCPDLHHF